MNIFLLYPLNCRCINNLSDWNIATANKVDESLFIRIQMFVTCVQTKVHLYGQLKAHFNGICCNYGQFCNSSKRHMYKEMKSMLAYWHSPGPFFRVYPRRFWTEQLTRLLWPRQIVCYLFGSVAYWARISCENCRLHNFWYSATIKKDFGFYFVTIFTKC